MTLNTNKLFRLCRRDPEFDSSGSHWESPDREPLKVYEKERPNGNLLKP